ncbi:MAG TPA: Glu/Leu/Phe/Val dehydrogenase family protein, partial [Flavobacteriaceae bacterium]|nr:Glu/Leu/Phe/Val dehydrogenase family protein [Flavobacteriaceae bacterium]
VKHIREEGGTVYITDINRERMEQVRDEFGALIFEGENLYAADVDIYAPCAMGATINDRTIEELKAKVIAGAANNQLSNEALHGKLLQKKGIAYAPDFLINAGGIINVYAEIAGYDKKETYRKTENIYHTTLEIFQSAERNNCTTNDAAMKIAQDRIEARKMEKMG